jgi:hypothetical protein
MLLLHPGFPKTGTTSLQAIFAYEATVSPRLLYLGPSSPANNPRSQLMRSRRWTNFVRGVQLQRHKNKLAQDFGELCASHANFRSFTDIIISDEMLALSVPERWDSAPMWQNIERVVDATRVERREVVILLGVRDAHALLPSQYAQFRKKYRKRFRNVNDFLKFLLDGGWPGYTERFNADALRSGANALGLRLHLLPMAAIKAAQWVGPQGLLNDVFPWSRRHALPALNVRHGQAGTWQSDGITLFDHAEVVARRLPIRMPPEYLYRGLKAVLGRVRIESPQEINPDPALLEDIRHRFGSVEDGARARPA